jgi:hypothetical protein
MPGTQGCAPCGRVVMWHARRQQAAVQHSGVPANPKTAAICHAYRQTRGQVVLLQVEHCQASAAFMTTGQGSGQVAGTHLLAANAPHMLLCSCPAACCSCAMGLACSMLILQEQQSQMRCPMN